MKKGKNFQVSLGGATSHFPEMETPLTETEKAEVIRFIKTHGFQYRHHAGSKRCCDLNYTTKQVYEAFKDDKEWKVERPSEGNGDVHFEYRGAHDTQVLTMLKICKFLTRAPITCNGVTFRIYVYGGFARDSVEAELRAKNAAALAPADNLQKDSAFSSGAWYKKINDLDLMIEYPPAVKSQIDDKTFEQHVKHVRDLINNQMQVNESPYSYEPDIITHLDGRKCDINCQRNGEHRSHNLGDFFNYQIRFQNKRAGSHPIEIDITTMNIEDHIDTDINNLTMVYDNKSGTFRFKQRKPIKYRGRLIKLDEIIKHIQQRTFLPLFPDHSLFPTKEKHYVVFAKLMYRWSKLKKAGWIPMAEFDKVKYYDCMSKGQVLVASKLYK